MTPALLAPAAGTQPGMLRRRSRPGGVKMESSALTHQAGVVRSSSKWSQHTSPAFRARAQHGGYEHGSIGTLRTLHPGTSRANQGASVVGEDTRHREQGKMHFQEAMPECQIPPRGGEVRAKGGIGMGRSLVITRGLVHGKGEVGGSGVQRGRVRPGLQGAASDSAVAGNGKVAGRRAGQAGSGGLF